MVYPPLTFHIFKKGLLFARPMIQMSAFHSVSNNLEIRGCKKCFLKSPSSVSHCGQWGPLAFELCTADANVSVTSLIALKEGPGPSWLTFYLAI